MKTNSKKDVIEAVLIAVLTALGTKLIDLLFDKCEDENGKIPQRKTTKKAPRK